MEPDRQEAGARGAGSRRLCWSVPPGQVGCTTQTSTGELALTDSSLRTGRIFFFI
jgi:hypothetical protein